MKKFVYILLAFGIMGLTACEKSADDSGIVNTQEGYADLTISLNTPSLQVSTRTLASDPKNQGGSWTTWEKFVDGALLYRVTIFVVKEDGTLVAYRDFYSGSSDIKAEDAAEGGNGFYETSAVNTSALTGTAVKATFTSAAQMHGDIEHLTPGDYKVIAVANYAPIESDGNSYAGLGAVAEDGNDTNGISSGSDNNFTNIVKSILENFNESSGLNDFTQTGANGSAFFTYKLNSGTDRVCKQLPQPLVMIRNVTLSSGTNQLTGLLSRTFARVRLEVKNNDKSSMIGVSGLSFQDNYASQNAYLFNDVAAGTANLYSHFDLYDSTKGSIGVTSEDAITPAVSSMKRLPAGSPYTMLDCYILEGMISATYAFKFTATYWAGATGGTATANYRITSFYGGSSSDSYGLLEFMVYIRDAATSGNNGGGGGGQSSSSGSNYILTSITENEYSQTGTVTATTPGTVTDGTVLDPKYIWEITLNETATESSQIGVAKGSLLCIGSGLYLQAYDGSDDMTPKLGDTKSEVIFKINFSGQVENGTIFSYYDGSYYYLDSDDNHQLTWVKYSGTLSSITTSTPTSYQYLAFETIPGNKGTQTEKEITKSVTSSSTTGVTTNEIVRNDFFYGIVPVSISSDSAQ